MKEKFTSYFIKRRNVIYERARFNCRRQEEGEAVHAFIMDLHRLAEHCGFGELRDELIRDCIVVGLRDSRLSEKLQLQADLTLESAVTAARQTEQVKKQQASLKGELVGDGKQSKSMQLRKRNLKARGIGSVVSIASHLVHAQGVEDHRRTTRVNAQQKTSSVTSVGSADISKECAETLLESTSFSRKPSWVR